MTGNTSSHFGSLIYVTLQAFPETSEANQESPEEGGAKTQTNQKAAFFKYGASLSWAFPQSGCAAG